MGTLFESHPNGKLSTHLHNICWPKSGYPSRQRCQEAWDYVIGKEGALKKKYSGVVDLQHSIFQVMNPTTNTLLPSPRGVTPWTVRLPMPFIEGMFPPRNPHSPSILTCTTLPSTILSGSHNQLICLLQHSVHKLKKVRQVLPQGLTQPLLKTYTLYWYVDSLSCRSPFHLMLSSNVLFDCVLALSRAISLENRLGTTSLVVFAQNSSSTLRFEFFCFLRYAHVPCPYCPAGAPVCPRTLAPII